jgi:hypothetical protein
MLPVGATTRILRFFGFLFYGRERKRPEAIGTSGPKDTFPKFSTYDFTALSLAKFMRGCSI